MGNFKDNPKKPYEVKVPNKIRKRIFMHERDKPEPRILAPAKAPAKKRGSMWSRSVGKVKKFFGGGK